MVIKALLNNAVKNKTTYLICSFACGLDICKQYLPIVCVYNTISHVVIAYQMLSFHAGGFEFESAFVFLDVHLR